MDRAEVHIKKATCVCSTYKEVGYSNLCHSNTWMPQKDLGSISVTGI